MNKNIAEGETVYRKVFVKDRLPTEKNTYFTGWDNEGKTIIIGSNYFNGKLFEDDEDTERYAQPDWYIEETTISVKSAKSIEECLDVVANTNGFWCGWNDSDLTDEMKIKLIAEAMQLYLESNSQINMPSDEIDKLLEVTERLEGREYTPSQIVLQLRIKLIELRSQITQSKQVEKKEGEVAVCDVCKKTDDVSENKKWHCARCHNDFQ